MKTLGLVLLLFCLPAFGQNSDSAKYAERPLILVDPSGGSEGVMPVLVPADGQQHLEFIPISQVKESMNKGAKPIRFGDVLSLLGSNTETINQLKAENEKLWKVAMKSDGVTIQQAAPSRDQVLAQEKAEAEARRQRLLQTWLMLQRPQPYQLPMPANPNANRIQANCTTYRLGDITHTSCN